MDRDFYGSPVAKTSFCNAKSASLIPGWGAEIPYASWPKKKKKKQKINETEPILNLLQYCFRKFFLTFYSMFYYWDIYSEKYAQRHMV